MARGKGPALVVISLAALIGCVELWSWSLLALRGGPRRSSGGAAGRRLGSDTAGHAPANAAEFAEAGDCGKVEMNVDYRGGDLSKVAGILTATACATECWLTPACKSYTFAKAQEICYLKGEVQPGRAESSCCVSGLRPCAEPPSPPPRNIFNYSSRLADATRGSTHPGNQCSACLCVFDIDRTLTGKQSDTQRCPRNRVLPMLDAGYSGGNATLSALAATGIMATPCNECYLGITSAGHGSGEHSEWNRYILDNIMRGKRQDVFTAAHPESKHWSYGTNVHSPYVLGQPDRFKQNAVELIREWYGAPQHGVCIKPENVFFFGDRTENIAPFQEKGLNSREVSCSSRDMNLWQGGVGYCGAAPEEVKIEPGNILCR